MIDWEAALIARLRDDAAVAAIFARRIDWLLRPQADALPAITLQTVVEPVEQHLKGLDSVQRATVQVDVWAASFATMRSGREAVIAALLPPALVLGVRFRRASVSKRNGTEQQGPTTIYRASLDFGVWFSTT